jgi:5-methylthioadenosine/S-adenosylhomocysteine deaminase
MGTFLIKNCDIADFDSLGFERRDILIQEEKIAAIKPEIFPSRNETVIDACGMMALPGFVDCHAHLMQTFLKGYMDDYPITSWLIRMFKIEDLMDEEDNYYAVLLGCLESLRFGTTAINDMGSFGHIDSTVQAVLDSGIRATLGMSHTDIAENRETRLYSIDQSLKETEDVYGRYHGAGNGLVRIGCAPAGLPACSGELMRALKEFAGKKKLVFHTHLAEGRKETADVKARTGMGEGEALFEYGLLDEYTLLAHSIWLEDYELDLIKQAKASPVHCPGTNLKISDGIPKIHSMLERGINVCIGCDGEASSSSRDMIREARTGACLQKGITLVPQAMNIGTTYKMLTQNGAAALRYDNSGSLAEGKDADLILVNTENDIALSNQNTRLSNFLYAGTGYAVDTVFVNGRLLLRAGMLQMTDLGRVLSKCEELLDRLDKKITAL